jgi:hypothetical protein
MANNTLKYKRIDPARRAGLRARWNRPILWPVAAALVIPLLGALPAVVGYVRRTRSSPR